MLTSRCVALGMCVVTVLLYVTVLLVLMCWFEWWLELRLGLFWGSNFMGEIHVVGFLFRTLLASGCVVLGMCFVFGVVVWDSLVCVDVLD